jgi:hypothetical protein
VSGTERLTITVELLTRLLGPTMPLVTDTGSWKSLQRVSMPGLGNSHQKHSLSMLAGTEIRLAHPSGHHGMSSVTFLSFPIIVQNESH